jgi:hypothetical protein
MRCPIDNTNLMMTDRNGIEIDYCRKCRGLVRGELDKIIERSTQIEDQYSQSSKRSGYSPPAQASYQPKQFDDDDYERKVERYMTQRERKRKSFLGDMFDIFEAPAASRRESRFQRYG